MGVWLITPTWNNAQDFNRCVRSVISNTDLSLIEGWVVIENGSRKIERDAIANIVFEYFRRQMLIFSLLENATNQGIPNAQNKALDYIQSSTRPHDVSCVFLDADIVAQPGWLTKLVSFAEAHPDIGIVGGAKSPQGTPSPVYHTPDGRWYVHDRQHKHPSGFMEGESIDFCCAYLQPELLARGLRMDTAYEIYDGYDQDMSFRVRSWGYRIWQIDAGVLHYASSAMKVAGYQWQGGGREEWDQLRAKNVQRFARLWKPFLAAPRATIEEEMLHMRTMNEKLVAKAGDRKAVPAREAQ